MSTDPTAQAAFRVPRSEVDGLFVPGHQMPESRVGVGTVVSVDSSNTCTVLINDEDVTGVMWLGFIPPRVDDVVEIEMRGDLLVVPAMNDLDTFMEGQEATVAHIVSTDDPGSPPAKDLQVGGSMRSLDAWFFYGADTLNWSRELSSSGQGMRLYQPTPAVFVARNLATIPSGEGGTGPDDFGNSWTGVYTGTYYSTSAQIEPTTERAYVGSGAFKVTWLADPKPSSASLKIGGHTIGQQYTAQLWVYVPTGSPDVRLVVQGVAGSAVTAVKDSWVQLTLTYTATAAEHSIGISTPAAPAVTVAGTAYMDAVSVVAGATVVPYFDGATTDTTNDQYVWLGSPDLSVSRALHRGHCPLDPARHEPPAEPVVRDQHHRLGRGQDVPDQDGFDHGEGRRVRGPAGERRLQRLPPPGRLPRPAVTAGQTYTFSTYARLITGTGLGYTARIYWYDAAQVAVGSVAIGDAVDLTSDWKRLSVTAVAPAGAVTAGWTVLCPTGVNSDTWEADARLVEAAATPGTYFDGSTAATEGNFYRWEGTAHASVSTWRTAPPTAPPGSAGVLWSEMTTDIAPGDALKFEMDLSELAQDTTAQVYALYGAIAGEAPLPDNPDVTTAAVGGVLALAATLSTLSATLTVPATVTLPTSGVVEPATVRVGVRLVGSGSSQVLASGVRATLTPAGWPLGSQWMDPDAETGGLVTIGDSGVVTTTANLASTTSDTAVPSAKKAVITAPDNTGGVAVVTFSCAVTIKTSANSMNLRLRAGSTSGTVLANTWITGPTDNGTSQVVIRGSIALAAGEEVTVIPVYSYAGTGVTVPHVVSRQNTMVEFYPGAVRSGGSSDPMIRYWDGDSWRPDTLRSATFDLSTDAGTAPPTKTNTTTTLARSASTLHSGQNVTLTATVAPSTAGAVTFYRATSTSGPWTSLGAVTLSGGKASKAWKSTSSGTYYFKATYGGSATHNPSTSAITPATVWQKLVTKTLTLACAWAQAYEGSGSKLSGTGHDGAVRQGYYSSTDGNCKSLLRFNHSAIPAAATVTAVTLVCRSGGWDHWYSYSGGDLIAGAFYNTPNEPTSWPPSADTIEDRSRHHVEEGGFSCNLTSWACGSLGGPTFSGITIGPGPGNSQSYYGYSASPGKDQFTLKVTYETWE